MARAFLGIGSNLGDREKNISHALQKVEQIPSTAVLRTSGNYETEPVGRMDQDKFMNAAAIIETRLPPEELLIELKLIETLLGRTDTGKWGPRVIDLDILAYEDEIIDTPELTIPHPAMADRYFVLKPLAEIAGDAQHPVLKEKYHQLLLKLTSPLKIKVTALQETELLAKALAKKLNKGLVIALNGDLGTGKTTFVRFLARHFGLADIVSSPTFVLLNIYSGPLNFYHFDLYRLNSLDDLEIIGAEEYIPSADGVTLIEWADKIPEILPPSYLKINITMKNDQRTFEFQEIGRDGSILEGLKKWQS